MARTVRAGHSAMRERRLAEQDPPHDEERDVLKEIKQSIMKLKKVAAADVMQAQVSTMRQLVPSKGMMYFLPPDWEAVYLDKPKTLYKVVTALKDQRIVSVFDGKTQYRLGHATVASRGAMSWPPRDAVLYCYDDPKEALGAKFPKCSKVLDGPLFLMKCEGWGRSFRNEDRNMWAVEYLKPVTFLFSNGTLQGIDVDDLY